MNLDTKTTQEIADELSQRLEDVSNGILPPIGRVDRWLIAIANSALNGLPIVSRGIEVANKRKSAQDQAAKKVSIRNNKTTESAKYNDINLAVAKKIRDLADSELEAFITRVKEIKHIQKNMLKTVTLLHKRELPDSPLDRAAVIEFGVKTFSLK